MTNLENNNFLLTESDVKFIAKHLMFSQRQIRHIICGKRGKRNTKTQNQIKKALYYRSLQNLKFIAFCKRLKNTDAIRSL